jgi:alanine dehydrogenase
MPGAVPRTSTFALNNSTLPYAIEIAEKGYEKAANDNKAIAYGINMINGALTCEPVGKAFGIRSEIISRFVA